MAQCPCGCGGRVPMMKGGAAKTYPGVADAVRNLKILFADSTAKGLETSKIRTLVTTGEQILDDLKAHLHKTASPHATPDLLAIARRVATFREAVGEVGREAQRIRQHSDVPRSANSEPSAGAARAAGVAITRFATDEADRKPSPGVAASALAHSLHRLANDTDETFAAMSQRYVFPEMDLDRLTTEALVLRFLAASWAFVRAGYPDAFEREVLTEFFGLVGEPVNQDPGFFDTLENRVSVYDAGIRVDEHLMGIMGKHLEPDQMRDFSRWGGVGGYFAQANHVDDDEEIRRLGSELFADMVDSTTELIGSL